LKTLIKKRIVYHINGDKLDNNYKNLKWINASETPELYPFNNYKNLKWINASETPELYRIKST
jgi:hypothetical protein